MILGVDESGSFFIEWPPKSFACYHLCEYETISNFPLIIYDFMPPNRGTNSVLLFTKKNSLHLHIQRVLSFKF